MDESTRQTFSLQCSEAEPAAAVRTRFELDQILGEFFETGVLPTIAEWEAL